MIIFKNSIDKFFRVTFNRVFATIKRIGINSFGYKDFVALHQHVIFSKTRVVIYTSAYYGSLNLCSFNNSRYRYTNTDEYYL